ncbi:hypothetical protein GCM10023149_08140 [Mucilaginibacter gynuensis]|uniref:Aspartyl protease n=1 Tax=Mucilaginibacter gynuensis TaxID=1302236 RepID=A0ABP8FWY9_9SPHI
MPRFKLSFGLIILLTCYSVFPVKAQVFEKTPELHGDIVVFPITLINAYPFISATVNGVTGKFMFDTGFGTSITINDNFVNLPDKRMKGTGVVASGQSFKTSINDTIREIRFTNGITYRNLEKINSGNYGFLQKHIAPDFLGYIGHQFFKDYLFKLDYLHRKVTFYKNSPERSISKDFLANEKVLAVIDFEIRKLANHPLVKIKIDGIAILGAFDTGQNGLLQLDLPSAKALKSRGSVMYSGTDSGGDTLLSVKNIIIEGKFKTALKGVELADLDDTQVVRRELGITEPNLLDIGYRFFSQYKTVWDYDKQKIYILEY